MTITLFGRKPKGKRRRQGPQGAAEKQAQNPQQLSSPSPYQAYLPPANQGWPSVQSPYQHHPVSGIMSQPCLGTQPKALSPLQKNAAQNAKMKSSTNLAAVLQPASAMLSAAVGHSHSCQKTADYLNQGAALCDLIASKLNAVITSIDSELFSGEERDLGELGRGKQSRSLLGADTKVQSSLGPTARLGCLEPSLFLY